LTKNRNCGVLVHVTNLSDAILVDVTAWAKFRLGMPTELYLVTMLADGCPRLCQFAHFCVDEDGHDGRARPPRAPDCL